MKPITDYILNLKKWHGTDGNPWSEPHRPSCRSSKTILEKYTMKISKVTMALISLLSKRAGAFTSVARRSAVSTAARSMALMPYDDDKMPFYALGTNLALQVGGQGNFKTLLDDDELEIVLEGASCLRRSDNCIRRQPG